MKLKVISDIHLEFCKEFPLEPNLETTLILAGDIGYPKSNEYLNFIQMCSQNFKYVILITGNHEYYGSYVTEIDDYISNEIVSKFKNTYFLNNQSLVLDGVIFWGGTLWSNIPRDKYWIVKSSINDFSLINGMNYDMYANLHKKSIESLNIFLNNEDYSELKRIVITHHAPLVTGTSNPKYSGKVTNCVFSTDLSNMVRVPINLWIFGHTHYSADFTHNNVRIMSNAVGYLGEDTGFITDKIIEI